MQSSRHWSRVMASSTQNLGSHRYPVANVLSCPQPVLPAELRQEDLKSHVGAERCFEE